MLLCFDSIGLFSLEIHCFVSFIPFFSRFVELLEQFKKILFPLVDCCVFLVAVVSI